MGVPALAGRRGCPAQDACLRSIALALAREHASELQPGLSEDRLTVGHDHAFHREA
jgi:hypothetical protein